MVPKVCRIQKSMAPIAAIVALSTTFLAPFAARRADLNAHNDPSRFVALGITSYRSTHLMLNAPNQQLATPEAAQAASFEESQVLGAQLATFSQPPVRMATAGQAVLCCALSSRPHRAWLVCDAADRRALRRGVQTAAEPGAAERHRGVARANLKLLTMNVAMSTATGSYMWRMATRTTPRPHGSRATEARFFSTRCCRA